MARADDLMASAIRAGAALGLAFICGAVPALAQTRQSETWIAPQRAAQRANPLAGDAASVKRGRALYERECLKCHGTTARGDGPQAKFLDTAPGDLTAESVLNQSDGALFWKISEGRGRMPKAKLNEGELWTVVNYVRALQRKR